MRIKNDGSGMPKYVLATIIFFSNIAVWIVIGLYLGFEMWHYIFIVVLWAIVAAVIVWYLQPKEDKDEWWK